LRANSAVIAANLGGVEIDPAISHLRGGKSTERRADEPWDAVVGEVAGRQHGVVARRQLIELGMSRRAIEGRLARGSLHRIHQGVFVVGVRRISRIGQWQAAVLACRADSVLSHRAAGELHRFLPRRELRLDVTVPPGRRVRRKGIRCHEAIVADDERTEVDGIPATSVFRTVVDLAGVLDARGLENAWNEIEVRELRDRLSIHELLERHRGRRGAASLRALLASDQPRGRTRNDFEQDFVAFLDAHRLPRGRINAPLAVRGRFFEIDCLWPDHRLAVELDGGAAHRTRRAFQMDRERDRILLAEGWRVIRVTWHQLQREPTQIAADLRQVLTAPLAAARIDP
jgi:very-short-patch-repair endonuclease/predicted transcriptional regulator of viral defense system